MKHASPSAIRLVDEMAALNEALKAKTKEMQQLRAAFAEELRAFEVRLCTHASLFLGYPFQLVHIVRCCTEACGGWRVHCLVRKTSRPAQSIAG